MNSVIVVKMQEILTVEHAMVQNNRVLFFKLSIKECGKRLLTDILG